MDKRHFFQRHQQKIEQNRFLRERKFKKGELMKDKEHKHKCPDCGIEFDCPCGSSCGVEYDKYPCIDHIMNHCIGFSSTKEGAEKLFKEES